MDLYHPLVNTVKKKFYQFQQISCYQKYNYEKEKAWDIVIIAIPIVLRGSTTRSKVDIRILFVQGKRPNIYSREITDKIRTVSSFKILKVAL